MSRKGIEDHFRFFSGAMVVLFILAVLLTIYILLTAKVSV